jgi:predicted nucleotidyltransferase
MTDTILASLQSIEREENVVILYACESGSRAWGFPSADSDYDVRFLYLRPVEWYLSVTVEEKRDVIERPIVGDLDINGWDLRKALRLMRGSNPALVEWLRSPIVYHDLPALSAPIREMMAEAWNPLSGAYHYRSIAVNTFNAHLTREKISRKKYFYALRPLLAVRWIESGRGLPPIEFGLLLDAMVEDDALRDAVDELLEAKKRGREIDAGDPIPAIDTFIRAELARLEKGPEVRPGGTLSNDRIDAIFRRSLELAWSTISPEPAPLA